MAEEGEAGPVSEENAREVIKNLVKSENFRLTDFAVSPFKKLTGLIGEHFNLTIAYVYEDQTMTRNFFLKTLSTNQTMLELSQSIKVYEKEEFYYMTLKRKLTDLGINVSFIPRSYLVVPFLVVLEDLGARGYRTTEKRAPLDLDHCKICLEVLAKFHASTIIYEKFMKIDFKNDVCLRDQFPDVLSDKLSGDEDNGGTRYIKSSIAGLLEIIDIIPEDGVKRGDFKKKLEAFLKLDPPKSQIECVVHGDLWSSNFVYLYEDDQPVDAKLLDFQTISYGAPQLDVLQFLMTNTRRSFREKNLAELLDYYHGILQDLLIEAGLNPSEILPRFVESFDAFTLPAKIHAIVDRSITFLSDEIQRDAMKSEESFRKLLFEERGRYIIESYNKDEEFRDVILEDVLELRDLLLK